MRQPKIYRNFVTSLHGTGKKPLVHYFSPFMYLFKVFYRFFYTGILSLPSDYFFKTEVWKKEGQALVEREFYLYTKAVFPSLSREIAIFVSVTTNSGFSMF